MPAATVIASRIGPKWLYLAMLQTLEPAPAGGNALEDPGKFKLRHYPEPWTGDGFRIPTGELRYKDGCLQQRFEIETYVGGSKGDPRYEWRDVPSVSEPNATNPATDVPRSSG